MAAPGAGGAVPDSTKSAANASASVSFITTFSPGCRVRSGRLGSGAASEALQAGLPPVLEADSIDWAAATMAAGTNSWLAQAHISGGATKSGVTRDDLSQPVHPGARRAEKELLEHLESETRRSAASRHASPETESGSARPGMPYPSGERPASVEDRAVPRLLRGGPDWRIEAQRGGRNTCSSAIRATYLLVRYANKDTAMSSARSAKQSQRRAREPYRSPNLARQARALSFDHYQRLTLAAEVDVYRCDPRCPLAARVKRKHQQIAASVSSAWHRPVPVQPGQAHARSQGGSMKGRERPCSSDPS